MGSTLFNVAITGMSAVYIIGDLGGSTYTVSYAVTIFGLGNAIIIPLADYSRKRLGFQRSILYYSVGFIFLTFALCLSPNYPVFLLFRFFQGFFSGPLFIITLQFAGAFLSEERREKFMKCVMLNFLTSPILGACFGGVLVYEFAWQWSFFIDGLLICLIFFLLLKRIWFFDAKQEPVEVDWPGAISFAVAVLGIGFFITMGQELDWFTSKLLVCLLVAGLFSLIYFIFRDLTHPNPLLNLALLKCYRLSFSIFQMTFLFSTYFGVIILLALWLSMDVNYTPQWIATVLMAMFVGTVVVFGVFWKMERRDSLWMLGIGIVLLAASSFYSSRFNYDIDLYRIAVARLLAGAGFATFFPPILAICITSCQVMYKTKVLAYFQLIRVLSSSIGAIFYTTLWQRRYAFYHSRLGGELTPYSPLTDGFFAKLQFFNLSGSQQVAKLGVALNQQAKSLAINDCLYLMGWIMIVLLVHLIASALFTKVCSTSES